MKITARVSTVCRALRGLKEDLWSLAQCANHISDATLAAWSQHHSPPLKSFTLSHIYVPLPLLPSLKVIYSFMNQSPSHRLVPLFFSLVLLRDFRMSHSLMSPGRLERRCPAGEVTVWNHSDQSARWQICGRLFFHTCNGKAFYSQGHLCLQDLSHCPTGPIISKIRETFESEQWEKLDKGGNIINRIFPLLHDSYGRSN